MNQQKQDFRGSKPNKILTLGHKLQGCGIENVYLNVSKQNVYPDPSKYCGPYKPVSVQKQNKRATSANEHAHDTIGRCLSGNNNNNNNPTLLLPIQRSHFKHLK